MDSRFPVVLYHLAMTTVHTTYQRRGYLTRKGYAQLDEVLRWCATLYNAGLQHWRDAYSVHVGYEHATDSDGKPKLSRDGQRFLWNETRQKRAEPGPSGLYDLYKELTALRGEDDYWAALDTTISRGVLQRFERAKQAFFRRLKAGEKPGYPRWKSGRRWKTIDLSEVRPGMVKGNRVKVKGLPVIEIKKEGLPPSADLKSLRITRQGRRVTISLTYAVEREPLPPNPACVGIDMGIIDRMALSTGEVMMAGGEKADLGRSRRRSSKRQNSTISGAPITSFGEQGVAPDVTDSPIPISIRTAYIPVAPDVTDSPFQSDPDEDSISVAPDVTDSPQCHYNRRRPETVAPDVTDSPPPVLLILIAGEVAPDVTDSPRRYALVHARNEVAPDVTDSPDSALLLPLNLGVAPDVTDSPTPLPVGCPARPVAPDVTDSPFIGPDSQPQLRVAPDVTDSPRRRERGDGDTGVAPDVTDSPTTHGAGKQTHKVAPDVTDSPRRYALVHARNEVAPDVTDSPDSALLLPLNLGVAPDVTDSPDELHDPIKEMQRRLARCRKGSREWRKRAAILANARGRKRIREKNECHRATTEIVRRFGHIAVEGLNIRNMTRSAKGTIEEPGTNVAAKSGLNREIQRNTWGLLRQQLAYKAEWAGRQFVEVDPRFTSQTCSKCGKIGDGRKGKYFRCPYCGYEADADINASVTILRKSLPGGNAPSVSLTRHNCVQLCLV